jgi:hypothetical protein
VRFFVRRFIGPGRGSVDHNQMYHHRDIETRTMWIGTTNVT